MLRVFFKSGFFKNNAHALRHLEYLDKQGALFDGTKEVDLETAQAAINKFPETPKRWFVYSLTREDQQRLQVDRSYWQQLMETQRLVWAKAYNIAPDRLHVSASVHDVAHHPHIHVVLHGETSSDGFIVQRKDQELGDAFKRCRETVKGSITQEIFRGYTESIKVDKGRHRQQLNTQLEKLLLETGKTSHPIRLDTCEALAALAGELAVLPGKHQYGYLPPRIKIQVDTVLQKMVTSDPSLRALFELYRKNQSDLIKYQYVGKEATLAKKMEEWEKGFFHPSKGGDARRHNLIIRAAEAYADGITALRSLETRETGELLGRVENVAEELEPTMLKEQVPTREEAEHNRKKRELKRQFLRELERELGGPVGSEAILALHDARPRKGGWRLQADSTQSQILSAEKILLTEFPALNEKLVKLAAMEKGKSGDFLEKATWLHQRMLQYAWCLDRERGIIDFDAVRVLRTENMALSNFAQTMQAEAIRLLDEQPELRPQPGADLRSKTEELVGLCIKTPSVSAEKWGDDALLRKMAKSAVRETLLEYLPPENRNELVQPIEAAPSAEMQVLMIKVRAALERRLKKSSVFRTAFGKSLQQICEKLNDTKKYRYASLPTAAQKVVDETARMFLQQPMVTRIFKLRKGAEPDLTLLREWITEYANAATPDQLVDLTIPQKRQARYKFICAFDKAICGKLNSPKFRADGLTLANDCLGKAQQSEQENANEPEQPSYWKLNKTEQNRVDDWIAGLIKEDEPLSRAVKETVAMFEQENWLSEQLEKAWLQHIALERLHEWRQTPDKYLTPKYIEHYTPKTLDAAARNLMYSVAITLCDDTQRSQARMTHPAGHIKFHKTRIHKKTMEERGKDVGR